MTKPASGYPSPQTVGAPTTSAPSSPGGRTVTPNLSIANQNIISTDYLTSVNLTRVGGTASSTTNIAVGANLPSNDSTGTEHRTDVQFFDSLGNANNISFVFTKTNVDNEWDTTIEPPQGTDVLTIENSSGNVYDSIGQLEFTARPVDGATVVIEGITYEFDNTGAVGVGNTAVTVTANTTVAQDVATLVTTVNTTDSDFDITNNRIKVSAGTSTTVIFTENGTRSMAINPAGLLDSSGNPATVQATAFTVRKQAPNFATTTQISFTADPADTDTIVINGITYTFATGEAVADGDTTVLRGTGLAASLADLEAAVEANDPNFAASGPRFRVRQNNNSGANDTIEITTLASGIFTVDASGLTSAPTQPDGTAFDATTGLVAAINVDTDYAIQFGADGLPAVINITELEILGFANGAANMDDDPSNSPQITLDFGTIDEADGMTQFGAEFTPIFISQDGSRFGTFAGVTIDVDGLVTALFDNGEIRPVFQIPVATFVNPVQLEGRTGNVFNQTEFSGDNTLRVADTGPAGQVVQASLEASTVDIGEEFTKMIIVQRAFSAATKIISTADEMLEELTRIK